MKEETTLLSRDGLDLPFCSACGQWRIAARQFCAQHPDQPLTTRRASAHGEIFSYTISHVAMSPAVAELIPSVTVLVQTDDGLRLLAHLDPGAEPAIGARVVIEEAPETARSGLPGGGPRVARATGAAS
ncbi:MAG: OB-fold domain-containing protein [Microbacterium sp.]